MALTSEDPLDQIIRLQVDDTYYARNARPPMIEMQVRPGVKVTSVTLDGDRYAPAEQALLGARVWLDPDASPARGTRGGPVFESRNNITGSDDTMAFVITPFNLRIESERASMTAVDYVDPAAPERPLWQIFDPALYQRRLTACLSTGDNEVAEAIGVYDPYGYFRDRRRYLEKRIADGEAALRRATDPGFRAGLEAELQGFRSRIYQLELWGDRVIGKLQMKCSWTFAINGPQVVRGQLGGHVDTATPWPVEIWFGGWDGDLLLGYVRGSLRAPFTREATG
jgi:hypothetical protein